MCFVDMQKAFDGMPRKMIEWAMRKKGLSEVMVWAVMSLYDCSKTRVRVRSAYLKGIRSKSLCTSKDLRCRLYFLQ